MAKKEFIRDLRFKTNIISCTSLAKAREFVEKYIRLYFQDDEIKKYVSSRDSCILKLKNGQEFECVPASDRARGYKCNRLFYDSNISKNIVDCVLMYCLSKNGRIVKLNFNKKEVFSIHEYYSNKKYESKIQDNVVDIDYLQFIESERRKINKMDLTKCQFIKNNKEIKIDKKELDEFLMSGLHNIDYCYWQGLINNKSDNTLDGNDVKWGKGCICGDFCQCD